MKKELTWKTGDGREVVFVVELQKEEALLADHTMTKPCCQINYSATVAGKSVGGYSDLRTVKNHPVVVASLGALGIAKSNYDRIMAAVAEIKACEYWTEWHRKEAEANEIDQEYRSHVDRVEKMMNP
jgi:hypothetical protein